MLTHDELCELARPAGGSSDKRPDFETVNHEGWLYYNDERPHLSRTLRALASRGEILYRWPVPDRAKHPHRRLTHRLSPDAGSRVTLSSNSTPDLLGHVSGADNIVLAQISDSHLRVGGDDGASARALEAVVRSIGALDPAPQALLVSGDLADSGSAREYERALELLSPLSMPIHVLAGNHDDRDALRDYFATPTANGSASGFLQYATRIGPLRMVVCDTMLPGQNAGSFGPDRLGWLDAELASDRKTPTLVAMHHPPLFFGIRVLDENCLPAADRRTLGEVVGRNPQIVRIVAGHIHRTIVGALGGCSVYVCPSAYLQLHLTSSFSDRVVWVREPPGFALHVAVDGVVTSHSLPVGDYELVG